VPATRLPPTRGDATKNNAQLFFSVMVREIRRNDGYIPETSKLVVAGLVPITRLSPTRGDATKNKEIRPPRGCHPQEVTLRKIWRFACHQVVTHKR
jgi:hypothetical protein